MPYTINIQYQKLFPQFGDLNGFGLLKVHGTWQFGQFGENRYVVTISAPHKLQRDKKNQNIRKRARHIPRYFDSHKITTVINKFF